MDLTLVLIPSPHFELGSESHYYRSVPSRFQLQTLLELTEIFILITLPNSLWFCVGASYFTIPLRPTYYPIYCLPGTHVELKSDTGIPS